MMKRLFLLITFMAVTLSAYCQWECDSYDTGFGYTKIAQTTVNDHEIRIVKEPFSDNILIMISGNNFHGNDFDGDLSADIRISVDGRTESYYSYCYIDNGDTMLNICVIENADVFWEHAMRSRKIRFVIHNVNAPAARITVKTGNLPEIYNFLIAYNL